MSVCCRTFGAGPRSAQQDRRLDDGTPALRRTGETVILVHGLWMPAAIFAVQGHWLERLGYRVLRFGYPSVRNPLAQNAQALQRCIAATAATDIHLVGHSLGGLVILAMLGQTPDPRLRRAVLLGSPCLDSHCARRLARIPGMSALLGQSIADWLARPAGTTVAPPSAVAIGVLAGTRSFGLGRIVPGLPRPNDGVVAVAEAQLPGAADAVNLPVAHSEMLVSRRCTEQIAAFLETGRFLRHEQV